MDIERKSLRVLYVEDGEVDRLAFERFVRKNKLPYEYSVAVSVKEGRLLLESDRFDVVLLDYMLGNGTGFDLLDVIRSDTPVIFVTGTGDEETAVKAIKSGAIDYLIKDPEGNYLTILPVTVDNAIRTKKLEEELKRYQSRLEEMVEERTIQLQEANERLRGEILDRKQAEEKLKNTLERLRNAVSTTIQVIISTIEARDPYTANHQLRSADLARAIATEMELSPDRIEGIHMAGSIHDIGKLPIPAEILSKPSKLSDIEFALIKEHSQKGYEMLKDVQSPWPLAEIVYQHHERMDGSGYPRNLKGDEILMEARIMTVADVVEAMASHRPYRASLGIEAGLKEIEDNRGILYDADVVDVCLRLFREKGYSLP